MKASRLMKKKLMRMILTLVLRLMCTKDHRSRGKLESSRRTPTPSLTCLHTDTVTLSVNRASRQGDHEVEGRYALIIRDIYTGFIMAYPTARRDTDSVVRSIKHFCGRRKINQVYSDDGPELINACAEMKLNHDLSLPGRPQNNSLAERTNQFIIDQTSACLVHAGLPTCYWAQAIATLCHLTNVEEVNGSSAWLRLHGEEFKGEKIPFGALVDFKPSEGRNSSLEEKLGYLLVMC